MNALIFLAQAATLSPTVTPSATAIASVTTTPTATPFHVVMEQEPFWNSSLGIFIVIAVVLAMGALLGFAFKRSGAASSLSKAFADFTNALAYMVVGLAFVGIFVLGGVLLYIDHSSDNTKYVFAAILPLLGTWVGTVLAHYFQKENFAAATQSIGDLASKVAGTDKLKSTPVKTVMIRPDQIDTLPDRLLDKPDDQIKLSELITHLREGIKRDRLPLFKDNKKTGPATRVLHRSSLERFITQRTFAPAAAVQAAPAPPPAAPFAVADLTLSHLMNDPVLGAVVRGSFALVKSDATLADAKSAMDKASAALGSTDSCYDVFVTDNGNPDETVIGWITNDIINENAKV